MVRHISSELRGTDVSNSLLPKRTKNKMLHIIMVSIDEKKSQKHQNHCWQCSILKVVYWYNIMPKDNHSPTTASVDVLHRYHTRRWDVSSTPPAEPQDTQGAYEVGDIIWIKTPHSRCMTKFRIDHVTQLNSSQYMSMEFHVT